MVKKFTVQKNYYVPWPDDDEWNNVKNEISSSDVNLMSRGCDTILMWKLKYDALPAYIESTLTLLQVIIKKHYMMTSNNQPLSSLEEHELQLACSTALIRFVNHVSSIATGKGNSLYWSAKIQNIPDWIVNMRHEAAHGQHLPSLDAFGIALNISLKWLLDNYWQKNLVLHKNGVSNKKNENVADLFAKAIDVWDFCQNKKYLTIQIMKERYIPYIEELLNVKYTHFSYIPADKDLDIIPVLKYYKTLQYDCGVQNYRSVLNRFRCALLKFLQRMLTVKSYKQFFITSLLKSSFLTGKKINVQKWKKIFKIMQNARLLGKLLGNLFEMAGKGDKKASKWLMILYPSIKLLKKKWTTFKILKKQTEKCNINKLKGEIKSIKCNTDSHIQIELKLLSPPAITLNMMSAVLLNPETYNLKGLLWYLKFIKPPLPDSTINLIKDLVRIQNLEPNQKPEINEDNKTIYTINDLKELQPDTGNSILNPDIEITSGWSRSNLDNHVWNKTPLGLLPFQTKVNCNLPDNLNWRIEPIQMS